MKPEVKQHRKESDHWVEGPEEIPIALEEIMLRQKIRLEQEMEAQKVKIEKREKRLELERQIMVNSLVPDKSTVHI